MGIALLPPLWAVAAPWLGIHTGSVALICAGVYAANGNKKEDGWRICAGFLCGDVWACLALLLMGHLNWNENLELFAVLCVLGGLAVLAASRLEQYIFLPSWLCGWAVGLTIMTQETLTQDWTVPFQIAAAMLAGVWYVGAGVDLFGKFLLKNKEMAKEREDGN